jgi:hypothetical protein
MRDDLDELRFLIRSRFPIIVVETAEEVRFEQLVEQAANLEDQALFRWSIVGGVQRPSRGEDSPLTNELRDALKHVRQGQQNGVFVFYDAQPYLDNPIVVRQLRELALNYNQTARTLIMVGSKVELPADLQRMSATFRLSLPTAEEIRNLLREEISLWKAQNGSLKGDPEAVDMLVQHLVGFTRDDARRLLRQAIHSDEAINMRDVARVLRHKHESLGSGGTLSLELGGAKFADVGGQEALKRWLALRHPVFTGQAGTENLVAPKGVLLLGVQGGGKSLAAKAVAGSWRLPLLRLDFGALYNKFHGETERNLRDSLLTAEAMAPCVLWLDEVEKGLAAGGEGADGGVSRRVMGTFLTWLSERRGRVFVVATANDIEQLPPELMRKGRFDEIFFVDLPTAPVREEIFAIHLKKRGLDPAFFDLALLAEAAEGFSGAEIEQAIVSAQYEAHAQNTALNIVLLCGELRRTKPLSVTRAEDVEALRAWAAERTVGVD